jgi:hypothetical protein
MTVASFREDPRDVSAKKVMDAKSRHPGPSDAERRTSTRRIPTIPAGRSDARSHILIRVPQGADAAAKAKAKAPSSRC